MDFTNAFMRVDGARRSEAAFVIQCILYLELAANGSDFKSQTILLAFRNIWFCKSPIESTLILQAGV